MTAFAVTTDPRSRYLLRDVVASDQGWRSVLAVAPDDPYHFDHPLDHLPGMALLEGMVELARHAGPGLDRTGRRVDLQVTFLGFCELDEAVELRAARPLVGSDVLAVEATQGDRTVCTMDLTLSRDPRAVARVPAPRVFPAEPGLVNRHRMENVLVGAPAADGPHRSVALRPPGAGHALAVGPGRPHRLETVVDAGRQFATMICHVEHGLPADTALVLTGVTADLPCGLDGQVTLRWSETPARRGAQTISVDVLGGGADGSVCGSVGVAYHAVRRATFLRLRAAGRML